LETIDYMLRSSGVGGKACREVLGISADQDYNLFTVEYVQSFASDDLGSVGLPPKDSRTGRSSMYAEGMDEYEYAMMMDAEKQRSMSMMGPSTRSSSERGSSSRTRKTPPTSRTITTSAILETEQTFLFRLNIQLPEEVKPEAEELMDAILFNLRTVLTGAFKEHVQRLRDQLKLADEEAARTEQELNAKQKDLRSNFGSRILDRTRILTDIENIRKDIQKVEMEQAADQANIDETTRQIAKIQAGMQEETGKDTVTAELTTLLQLQQQNVANMKKLSDGGRASIGEFSDAMSS
jgi:hypothetical protein